MSEAIRTDDLPPRRTVADRLLGAVGIALVLAAVLFFFVGEGDDGAAAEPASVPPPPAITVHRPVEGEAVSGAFAVEFETPAEMVEGPGGWVAEDYYHLHAMVGGAEVMAAPGQLLRLGKGRWRWVLPALSPGEHRIRLQWSGPDHRTVEGGGSPVLRVLAR